MKGSRWGKALTPSTPQADPRVAPVPGAWDIRLDVNKTTMVGKMGPLLIRNPTTPLHHATVQWRMGRPQDIVTNFDFKKQLSYQYQTHGKWQVKIDWFDKDNVKLSTTQWDVYS